MRLIASGEPALDELARDPAVRTELLRGWKKQAEGRAGLKSDDAFPGKGRLTSRGEELRPFRVTNTDHACPVAPDLLDRTG